MCFYSSSFHFCKSWQTCGDAQAFNSFSSWSRPGVSGPGLQSCAHRDAAAQVRASPCTAPPPSVRGRAMAVQFFLKMARHLCEMQMLPSYSHAPNPSMGPTASRGPPQLLSWVQALCDLCPLCPPPLLPWPTPGLSLQPWLRIPFMLSPHQAMLSPSFWSCEVTQHQACA